MNNLAIIPARGGSKRIPRKNIKDFFGKPIIFYSINAALSSGLFEEVMVSTDDDEIARLSLSFGASVPFMRNSNTSGDYSTTLEVLSEVLAGYRETNGRTFSNICCIYPAAPLIKSQHLQSGFELLLSGNFKSVFPVVEFSYPIWRGLCVENGNKAGMIWPQHKLSRSQDLQKVFHDAGQWYWINNPGDCLDVFTGNSGCLILSENEVQDIDNPDDWTLAELKYKMLNEKRNSLSCLWE